MLEFLRVVQVLLHRCHISLLLYIVYFVQSHFVVGELLLLESKSQVRVNGEPRIVGRSYDGNSWESVSDLDFAPDDVSNPTAGKYKVFESL